MSSSARTRARGLAMPAKFSKNSGRILSSIPSSVAAMTTTRSISAPAKGTVMDFVSVRVITHDVERLATFWEQVTGLPATRPVPAFAELKTPAGTIAIGAPATVGDARQRRPGARPEPLRLHRTARRRHRRHLGARQGPRPPDRPRDPARAHRHA